MKKSFYFYTSIALTIILGLVIGNYIFGWTTPTANPPSSNLPAPINTGSTNQSKSGYLAVGTTTTPTYPLEVGNQLRVWGQLISKAASGTAPFVVDSPTKVANLNVDLLDGYDSADLLGGSVEIPVIASTYFYNGGTPYYCKKKTVNDAGYVTFSNINDDVECGQNKFCSSGECVSGTNHVYCDEDDDGHYSISAVASYTNCPSGRYRYNQAGDDCDDNCSTCYPGSTASSTAPDGLDQDCDGTIDEIGDILCTPSYGTNVIFSFGSSCAWVTGSSAYPNVWTQPTLPTDTTHCKKSGLDCTSYVGGWKDCRLVNSGVKGAPSGSSVTCFGHTWYKSYTTGDQYIYNAYCDPMTACTKTNYYN